MRALDGGALDGGVLEARVACITGCMFPVDGGTLPY